MFGEYSVPVEMDFFFNTKIQLFFLMEKTAFNRVVHLREQIPSIMPETEKMVTYN